LKRLHKLVVKSFLGPFFLIFFIVMFILLMQFLWRYIDDLVGKGLEFKIITELIIFTSASLVPMALPLSILMSSLMTMGNMGEYYELTAIKASGIPLQRVMTPMFIIVFFLSIGAFLFANNVMPYTNLKMRALLYDVRQQRPELQIKTGEFYSGIEGYSIRINKRHPETNMLYGLQLYDHTERSGNTTAIFADSGTMKMTDDESYLIVTLYNGQSYNELEEERRGRRNRKYPHRQDKFDEQRILIELSGFALERTDENLFKNSYQMMNLSQLEETKDSLHRDINNNTSNLKLSLMKTIFFKARDDKSLYSRFKKETDTLLSEFPYENTDSITTVDLDSLFNRLELYEKQRAIDQAFSYARAARGLIDNNMKNIDFKIRRLRRYEVEWHRKFTIAFACLVFLMIGAPLGAIIRKGGLGMPVVVSTLFFIFYYVISLMGEKFVRESILSDLQGMWISSVILFILGIFLTYKATTDSYILNADAYHLFIKRSWERIQGLFSKLQVTKTNSAKA